MRERQYLCKEEPLMSMLFKQCQFLNLDFTYPSGRLAVCQSYSDLPWGGLYTNIFSDWPNPVILGTFTPFGCGSISCPRR